MPRAMTFQAPVNIQVGSVFSGLGGDKLYQGMGGNQDCFEHNPSLWGSEAEE